MSGQPYKKPQDITKFRAKYIESLNMRQELDKITCDAVRNYNATGQLPASSQMKDSRTTADILADTQRVKSNICSQLAEVSNMQFAQEVVQGVMNSPINIDNNLFVFMAQRINSIVEELKKIYSYKIKGDSDDVRSLVTFIERMYTDKNRLMASTKSFMDSLGISDFSESGGRLQAAKNALNKLLIVVSELNKYKKTKNDQNMLNQLYEKIKIHLDLIPDTAQQIQDLQDFVTDHTINEDKGNVYGTARHTKSLTNVRQASVLNARKYLDYIYNRIPDVGTIQSLITQYNKFLKRQRLSKDLKFSEIRELITKIGEVLDRGENEYENMLRDILISSTDTIKKIFHSSVEWSSKLKKVTADDIRNDSARAIRKDSVSSRYSDIGTNDELDAENKGMYDDMPELAQGSEVSSLSGSSNTGTEFIEATSRLAEAEADALEAEAENNGNLSGEIELNDDDDNKPVEESIKQTLDAVQDSTLDTGLNRSDQLIQGGLEEAQGEVQQTPEVIEPTPEVIEPTPIQPPDDVLPTYDDLWAKYQELAEKYGEENVKNLYLTTKAKSGKRGNKDWSVEDKYAYIVQQVKTGLEPKKETAFERAKREDREKRQKKVREDREASKAKAEAETEAPKPRSSGNGVGTRKTFKDCVMSSKTNDGIEPVPRYYKFGRWLVNLHKLNGEGIFVVRRPSGSGIAEFPSIKVSEKLGNVFKKMIKGGSLTYSDINGLTEAEKIYLHKVSSKAQIVDKFDIPAPPKEEVDKEIHTFEVMKGEILAGNDNAELIKKFKLLLVKLMRTSKINRKQGYEILEELAELGY
jgi:hypothetical protein